MKTILLTETEVDDKRLFVHLTMNDDEFENFSSDWVMYKRLGTEYLIQMLEDYENKDEYKRYKEKLKLF